MIFSIAVSGEASLVKHTVNFFWFIFHHREESIKWSMEKHNSNQPTKRLQLMTYRQQENTDKNPETEHY